MKGHFPTPRNSTGARWDQGPGGSPGKTFIRIGNIDARGPGFSQIFALVLPFGARINVCTFFRFAPGDTVGAHIHSNPHLFRTVCPRDGHAVS